MDPKNSSLNQRPSSSTLTRSRQAPLKPTLLFPPNASPLKPKSKDLQSQDQSTKPHQPRQINSARVSQERTSFSPSKLATSRPTITSSSAQKNPLSARKGIAPSTRSTSSGLGINKEGSREKKTVITSPMQAKLLTSADLMKGVGKLILEPNPSTSDLSQYGSCHSTKASRCPSGLLATHGALEEMLAGSNIVKRKNSGSNASPVKSPQLMSQNKLESDLTNASTDYVKSPKVPGNTEKQIKVANVPSIDMKPLKKSRDEIYRSAPNSIDRYDFYSENFSLGKISGRTTQKPAPKEAKIAITIVEASQTATPQAGTPTYSILDQITNGNLRPNSALTVPTVTASPKLTPLGMILQRECIKTDLDGDGDGDSILDRTDTRANSAYLMPKRTSEKSSFGKKQRQSTSMIHMKKQDKSEQVKEAVVAAEKQRVSSKDRNMLMQPGSQSYGKFGTIYKGIENKDSWRFSVDRFKKLERQSGPKISSERSQEPKKNLETEKLNSGRDRCSMRSERLSIGKESLTSRKDVNQSWNKVRESKIEESVSRSGEKEDALSDAVGYLTGLKSKGLLEWLSLNKGDSKLYHELELMKKEIENMSESVNEAGDDNRKEELEEKLLMLLDMTVNNLSMIIEKKAKV